MEDTQEVTITEKRSDSPSMEEAVSDLIGCIAFGCSNRCDDGFEMIKLPTDSANKKKWLENMKREKWDPPSDVKICEVHFSDDEWEYDAATKKRKLKPNCTPKLLACNGDSVPTLPYSKSKKCCAYECNNREGFSSPDISFHQFPDKAVKDFIMTKWKNATGDPAYEPNDDSYICSYHFSSDDVKIVGDTKIISTTTVPTNYVKSPLIKEDKKEEDVKEEITVPDDDENDPYLEIHGLDPSKHSDLNSDIRHIAEFFGVYVDSDHIHRSFIVKKKNKETGSVTADMVIVKFSDISKKKELLTAFKKSDNALVDSDKGESIFLTGQLSAANKKLLMITEKIPVNEMKNVPGEENKANSVKTATTKQGSLVVKKVVRKIVVKPNEPLLKGTSLKPVKKSQQNAVSAKDIMDMLESDGESKKSTRTTRSKQLDNSQSKSGAGSESYDKLKSNAMENKVKVQLKRLEDLTMMVTESASKPSRQEEESSEDEEEEVVPKKRGRPSKAQVETPNKRGRPPLSDKSSSKPSTSKTPVATPSSTKRGKSSLLETPESALRLSSRRRQVVKPKRYRDEEDETEEPPEKKPIKEVYPPPKKVAAPVKKDSPLKKAEAIKKENPVPKKKAIKKDETESDEDIEEIEVPDNDIDDPDYIEPKQEKEEISPPPKSPLKKVIVQKIEKILSASKTNNGEISKKNNSTEIHKKNLGNARQKKMIEFSDTESGEETVSEEEPPLKKEGSKKGKAGAISPKHGTTPVSSSNILNNLSSGILPQGLTPINIPQSPNTPPTNPNNFKLITNFDQLIFHLKERQLLESHIENLLIKNFRGQELYRLMRCKDINNPVNKFSELQVKFALILLLYSSKCFEYLDSVFALPPVTSLENLLLTSDFKPGFLEESLKFLGDAFDSCGRITLKDCFLAVDCIPIDKKLIWDDKNSSFVGSSKIYDVFDYHNNQASTILLVMLCSLEKLTSIPIAYFPLDTVDPDFMASIIKISINKLYERRIKVHCIVLDASESSFVCGKILGCSLAATVKIQSTYVIKNKPKIPIIHDCYHLARLARDTLASLNIIGTNDGCAEWKYINLINKKLMNKFSSNPKDSSDKLMTMKFNSSLAIALEEQKNSGDMAFNCCIPTATFIKNIDKVVSIFSYNKLSFAGSNSEIGFLQHQAQFLSEFSQYFRNLKIENESLFKNDKYEFVKGLYFTMNSICIVYDKIKKMISNKDIPKHRLTLDPIDLFYYCSFSNTDNVNCLNFQQGLRNYVNQVISKNLPPNEIPPLLIDFRSEKRSYRALRENKNNNLYFVEALTSQNLKSYTDDILKLIAVNIIDSVVNKIQCLKCIDILHNRNDNLTSVPANDENYSKSIWDKEIFYLYSDKVNKHIPDECFKIIKKTEQIFNHIKLTTNVRDLSIDKLCDMVVAKVKRELYGNLSTPLFFRFNHRVYCDVDTTTHEIYLTRLIIENYVKFRMTKIKMYSSVVSKFDTLFFIV